MKIDKLGWIVAAAMAGAMAMSGFQGQSLKFASCDVGKVFVNSNLFKQNSAELDQYKIARTNVLKFLVANREMSPQDAIDYAQLSLAKTKSDADNARLAKITSDAAVQAQKHRDLLTKKDPTPDDQTVLADFSARMQLNNSEANKLDQQYSADVQTEGTRLQTEALDKVRKAIHDVATSKGYNIVFGTDSAPYAENNITDQALVDVNKS